MMGLIFNFPLCLSYTMLFFMNKYFSPKRHNVSVDELEQALELTDKQEISDESTILQGIIRFGGETA